MDKECGETYIVGDSINPAHTVILSLNSSIDGEAQECSLDFRLPDLIPGNIRNNFLVTVEHLTLPYSPDCHEEKLSIEGSGGPGNYALYLLLFWYFFSVAV